MKTIDQVDIRQQNVIRIWEMLSLQPRTTRKKLASGTGLSLMTVTNLIDCLNKQHVLEFEWENQVDTSGRRSAGRRAELISISETRHAWVILDLTDIYFRYYAMTLNKNLLPSAFVYNYRQELDYAINLTDFLRRVRTAVGKEQKQREILGIAVVTPGPYDVNRDKIRNKRVPELNHICIRELLRKEVGLFDYFVDEDVKFSVCAFSTMMKGSDNDILYYLYMGEGVGGAALYNGTVLRGQNSVAGDAAQLLMPDGKSFESRLSIRAFARECGIADDAGMNSDQLQAAINRCALDNFPVYQAALFRLAETAGRMLHNVVWLLDPTRIVIDCPYINLYREHFISQVRSRLCVLLGGDLDAAEILVSPYEMRSVLLGASQLLGRKWIERVV